jgi:hypothetical protein
MESNTDEIIFSFGEKDGAKKPRLTVNKKLLMENSSVLNKILSVPKVIAIEDIEKSIFLKMVNCLNGKIIDINIINVFRLMDAAQKYMVEPLMGSCDKFIIDLVTSVTSDNECTIRMLDSSLKYNRVAIKEKCLDIILDDPLRFFEDKAFLNIKEDTLKLILTQPKINCTVLMVLRAAKEWLEHNKIATVEKLNNVFAVCAVLMEELCIEESVLKDKQFYSIKVVSAKNDDKFIIKKFRKITETISLPDSGSHLYGLVLIIGVHPECEKEIVASDYKTDTISIDIKVSYEFRNVIKVVNQPLSKHASYKVSNFICV